MSKLSIIIPVFNAVTTLERCLQSIFNQDYLNYEIIVIDGNSTDGSIQILESQQSKFSYYISEPDQGPYDAMNKGIEKAQGSWLYFMGADDFLADGAVLSTIFNSDPKAASILFGYVENIDRRSNKIPRFHHGCFSKKLYWKNCLHHQSAFYHRSLFEQARFNLNYKILADYDLNLQFLHSNVAAEEYQTLICKSTAAGLSKNFRWSLYREELRLKYVNLNPLLFTVNIFWVIMKFLYKNTSSPRAWIRNKIRTKV